MMKRIIPLLLAACIVSGCGEVMGPRRDRDLSRRLPCGITVRADGTYLLTYLGETADLSKARELKVSGLELIYAKDADLSQLEGMPLRSLTFLPQYITNGLDTVRGMKTLKTINHMPAADFWQKLDNGEFRRP